MVDGGDKGQAPVQSTKTEISAIRKKKKKKL